MQVWVEAVVVDEMVVVVVGVVVVVEVGGVASMAAQVVVEVVVVSHHGCHGADGTVGQLLEGRRGRVGGRGRGRGHNQVLLHHHLEPDFFWVRPDNYGRSTRRYCRGLVHNWACLSLWLFKSS